MRPLFTVVLILATMATAAIAQTSSPESRTAAVRLVEALNWRGAMEPIRAEMLARTKTNLRARLREELGSPTAEEYAEVEAMVDQVMSKYTLDDTIADIVPLLQAHYGTAAMEELATFFSSPVYKKFQEKIPEIKREALETAKRKVQPAIQDAVHRVSARIDEMKKARSGK
ncbi:MAG: DUF2059 domain-containing protein [Terriglobales bacterium]